MPLIDPKDTFAKLLFPSFVAGLIIGKEGGMISELMYQTQANVKFSPGRELYPGTQERVCIVTGQIPNIVAAVRGILEKIQSSDSIDDNRSLKLLVSNIASGIVIGKSGTTVKMIQQDYSVRIQITNKDESRGLPERTLTILADNLDYILSAFENILERIGTDPESDKWRRLASYSAYNVPSINSKSVPQSSSISTISSNQGLDYSSFLQSFLHQQSQQSHSSFTPQTNSFPLLGTSAAPAGSNYLQASMSDPSSQQMGLTNAMLSYMYSQSLTSAGSYYSRFPPIMIDGVNLTVPGATLSTYEVAVPEVMVTAIFGSGLKVISDVMQSTATRIQLSSKGDYIPGTYNRKLTIAGPILSVQAAHLIIMQNIVKEQEAFRKQGLI